MGRMQSARFRQQDAPLPTVGEKAVRTALKSLFSANAFTLTCGITLLVVLLCLKGNSVLDLIELKTYDMRFKSRGRMAPHPAVVLALIDEKSLDAEGRWPWPRSRIADLVDVLSREGVKVIGFDIGFLEPDENSRLDFIRRLAREIEALDIHDRQLYDFIRRSRQKADNDRALAEAIRRSPAAVVLGYFFHMRRSDLNYAIDPRQIQRQLKRISPSRYPLIMYTGGQAGASPFIRAYAPEGNLAIFTEAADASGYYSVKSDRDGVVRWMPLVIQCGREAFPPLPVLCAWYYRNRPPLVIRVDHYGVEGIQMGRVFIPTDESGQLLINYLGPPKTFAHLSISDILSGNFPKGRFKGKIVLVGATALGTHDLRTTPVSPLYPGVEIHATVIDNILTQKFLTRPKWSRIFDLLAIVILGALTGLVLPRLGPLRGLLLATALFVLYIASARWFFIHSGAWLNMVYPLLALFLNYTILRVYGYVTEERERKKIKETFRHYVAPLVIEEMLKEPDRLKLGGEEKNLTVLFSDLAGFTSYAERLPPDEMIAILSQYFEKMTEQIFAYRGTLKDYVGDEFMAIFGAPLERADHAHKACEAALAMRRRLAELHREWAATGRPLLTARTGINSGPMLVGNLGCRYRFVYGALGDNVNLGSRLEGINKVYGTEILLGENTARQVEGAFLLREIDMVRAKGKKKPVCIYELLGNRETVLSEEQKHVMDYYADGLSAYRRQHWQKALCLFDKALALLPQDGPSQTLAERCRVFLKTPPPQPWDGVFEQLFK